MSSPLAQPGSPGTNFNILINESISLYLISVFFKLGMLRRSMSGNTGLNTLAQTSGGMIRRNDSSGKLYMNPNG